LCLSPWTQGRRRWRLAVLLQKACYQNGKPPYGQSEERGISGRVLGCLWGETFVLKPTGNLERLALGEAVDRVVKGEGLVTSTFLLAQCEADALPRSPGRLRLPPTAKTTRSGFASFTPVDTGRVSSVNRVKAVGVRKKRIASSTSYS